MSSGKPDWSKLHEMGKLPKSARGNVPMLAQLDAVEKRLEEVKKGVCDDCRVKLFPEREKNQKTQEEVQVKCGVEGCDFVGRGKSEALANNGLRLHGKTHMPKA